MERIKVNKNWFLDEFIDPVTYFTTLDHGLTLVDPSLFDISQLIRDEYNEQLTINDWWKHLPKDFTDFEPIKFLGQCEAIGVPCWSGIRTELTNVGAHGSAHRLRGEKVFRAIDIRDKNKSGEEKVLMEIVRKNASKFYALGLRRAEDISITKGWLHLDTMNKNCEPNSIRVVDKTKCTEVIRF